MTTRLAIVLGLLCGIAACTLRRPPEVRHDGASHHPFIITFWCGPPLDEFTDSRAEEIAAAGFTVVGPPCEGGTHPEDNLRALDVAARHGLRMWVADSRFGFYTPLRSDWEARLDAAVAQYGIHPAFDGYFIHDEPRPAEVEAVGAIATQLRARDPAHLAYINLLPNFAITKHFETPEYDDYLEHFITSAKPTLISYDSYPFIDDGTDRRSYFPNLHAVRDAAVHAQIPFMLIVQAMPHLRYRDPTEAELAWQIFHAMAFGARGISYFAYWTPSDVEGADELKFHYGLIDGGRPTRHYFEAARLNRVAGALAEQLAGYRSLAVADSLGEIGLPFPIGPIDGIEGGPVTAGLFTDDSGELAVLLVNRDYRYGVTAAVRLRAAAAFPEIFDHHERRWHETDSLVIHMAPGDAQLLRWR